MAITELGHHPTSIGETDDEINFARLTNSVVRSNFRWAIAYNLIAIPFAVAGVVNPLIASVGMALSSAVVMLNVMRLGRASSAGS